MDDIEILERGTHTLKHTRVLVKVAGLDALKKALNKNKDAMQTAIKKALSEVMKKKGFNRIKKRSPELDALVKTARTINDHHIRNAPIAGELLRLFEIRERFLSLVGYRASLKPNSKNHPKVNFELFQLRTEELMLEYFVKKMDGKFVDYSESSRWIFDNKIISRARKITEDNFEKVTA